MTVNGITTTQMNGQENYTIFIPSHRPNKKFYQYDYRHIDGRLFSCVDLSLDKCRNKKDKWLLNTV